MVTLSMSVYVDLRSRAVYLDLILYSKHHVLHSILPDLSDFNYNLRPTQWRRQDFVTGGKFK